jgi:subtilase family serine protease
MFLSVSMAANVTEHPGAIVSRASVPASSIQGYTPDQIRTAYGINGFTLSDGSAGNGLGQTIAIVDPFNDPNVLSDLNVFDTQFNIQPVPTFTVVNQIGGAKLPRTDGSWAGEIATDVEWAHVIAPAANILLVEANSDNTDDLMTAVDYARHQPGVSVMSISWGGTDFAGQTAYDPEFKTPAGHTPITVVAASGDDGAAGGPQWPGDSINVLSVGGTTLTTSDTTGTYGSETSWTDSSGGTSTLEAEPSFQTVVQRSGQRTFPDVSLDANPNVGLALYDTIPYQGISGWQITDGTSVATPQWAGLVAIADQARALASQPALDGPGQTLPVLYDHYGAPGTAAYANYASIFHDIITPENALAVRGRPDIGYDTTSGLGTANAVPVINILTAAPPAASLTTPAQPLASPIALSFVKQPPASAVGSSSGVLMLRLTNESKTAFPGSVSISLYASTTVDLPGGATPIATLTLAHTGLGAHGSRNIRIPFNYPTVSQATNEYLFLTALTSDASLAPAATISSTPVTVAPPFVTLTPSFSPAASLLVTPGSLASANISIKNLGNVLATGTLSLNLYASTDQTLDTTADTLLTSTPATTLHLRPGLSVLRHVRFLAPSDQIAGSYYLIVSLTSSLGDQTNVAAVITRGVVHVVHKP